LVYPHKEKNYVKNLFVKVLMVGILVSCSGVGLVGQSNQFDLPSPIPIPPPQPPSALLQV